MDCVLFCHDARLLFAARVRLPALCAFGILYRTWKTRFLQERLSCGIAASDISEASMGKTRSQKFCMFRCSEKVRLALLVAGALFFLCAALPGRPVDSLHLERTQGAGCEWLLPLGHAFTTRYTHSVERTPVEDIYYGLSGRLHQWRTRTRSHNAGLPAAAPVPGRFVAEDSWLVLEGGRLSWEELYLRVGNVQFGQNELVMQASPPLLLYKLFPGERVRLSVNRLPLHRFSGQ